LLGRRMASVGRRFSSYPGAKTGTPGESPMPSDSATKQMLDSVSQTISGVMHINYVEEFDKTLSEEAKKKMKRFLIYRSNPGDPEDQPRFVSYYIDPHDCKKMYLDVLIKIKDEMDPTLVFRRSCREGICGSCSMNLNGLHGLACIKEYDEDTSKPAIISPLGHMFVLRDLVVDMTQFYTQYKMIEPYLQKKTSEKELDQEYYQSVADRKKIDGLYECVMCACCSTSCPSYWWNPDEYLGPAVLMQAYRWIIDSRDDFTEERLDFVAKGARLDDCQNIGMCSVTCPKGLDPQKALQNLFGLIKDLKERRATEDVL